MFLSDGKETSRGEASLPLSGDGDTGTALAAGSRKLKKDIRNEATWCPTMPGALAHWP